MTDQLHADQMYAYQVSSSSSRYVSWGAMVILMVTATMYDIGDDDEVV